jgi:hypothetical protein
MKTALLLALILAGIWFASRWFVRWLNRTDTSTERIVTVAQEMARLAEDNEHKVRERKREYQAHLNAEVGVLVGEIHKAASEGRRYAQLNVRRKVARESDVADELRRRGFKVRDSGWVGTVHVYW